MFGLEKARTPVPAGVLRLCIGFSSDARSGIYIICSLLGNVKFSLISQISWFVLFSPFSPLPLLAPSQHRDC